MIKLGDIVFVKHTNQFQKVFGIEKVRLRSDLEVDGYFVGYTSEEAMAHGYLERDDILAIEDFPKDV